MAGLGTFDVFLSGGATNTVAANSLGGVISTTRVYGQNVSYTSTSLGGVTLIDAAGNDPGTGQLDFIAATKELAWKPPGATAFDYYHDLSLGASNKNIPINAETAAPHGPLIIIEFDLASLPVVDTTVDVTVTRRLNFLFPDITAAQAESGLVRYRGIFLTSETSGVKLAYSIAQNSQAGDYFSLGQSPTGHTMELLPNDTTAPEDVVFSSNADPNDNTSEYVLTSGGSLGLWIRQTVPAYTILGADPAAITLRFKLYL